MRILDVGVAAGYALLCLGVISTMSPFGSASAAAHDVSDQRASGAVYQYIGSVGLVFLASASPPSLCQSLQGHSNSSVVLGGEADGLVCAAPPAGWLGYANVTLSFSGRSEVIEAWIEGA